MRCVSMAQSVDPPGSFQVKAGDNAKVTDDNKNNDAGITMDAVSGDIILRAPQGKIRIEAQDIELVANGYNGRTGYIALDSNEKLILKSKSVDIRAIRQQNSFVKTNWMLLVMQL